MKTLTLFFFALFTMAAGAARLSPIASIGRSLLRTPEFAPRIFLKQPAALATWKGADTYLLWGVGGLHGVQGVRHFFAQYGVETFLCVSTDVAGNLRLNFRHITSHMRRVVEDLRPSFARVDYLGLAYDIPEKMSKRVRKILRREGIVDEHYRVSSNYIGHGGNRPTDFLLQAHDPYYNQVLMGTADIYIPADAVALMDAGVMREIIITAGRNLRL